MPSFSHSWLPFLYLYGVGGVFFLSGLIIIHKSKSLDPQLKADRKWRRILIFGFFYFMLIHTILTIAALYW